MKIKSHVLVAWVSLFTVCQALTSVAASTVDVTKYAHDKRQITYEGRVVYRIPDKEIDAAFVGPIAFAGKVFFVDCERNDFIKLSAGAKELRQHFAKNRASIPTIFSGMDWSNYGSTSVVLTTKGILVWTGDGRAFMITDSSFVRRIESFDVVPSRDPQPKAKNLDVLLSGVVDIQCWPEKNVQCSLTLDLDREVKIGIKREPIQPPHP